MTAEPRLSYQALADFLRVTHPAAIAYQTDVERRSIDRIAAAGWMRLCTAERIADRLRVHPAEIWLNEYVEVVNGLTERQIRRAERGRPAA